MPRTLDAAKAEEVTKVARKLGKRASFRNVWKELARAGILRHNKTLRTYLDLLVGSGVLSVRMRDVGSVYSQQIYLARSRSPKVWVGLGILQKRGLNWDVPETDVRITATDFAGLVRSTPFERGMMASLEDCLVHEAARDAKKRTGAITFVGAMISTTRLDLPYLLRRADELSLGRTFRLLLTRILEVVSSNMTDLDASLFLAVRDRFLKIARQYAQSGFWKLIDDEKGIGTIGFGMVDRLEENDLILAAAKQLGVTG